MDAISVAALSGVALLVASLVAALGGHRLALAAQAGGMVLLGTAGAAALFAGDRVGAGFANDVSPAFGIDPLSGFFLLTLSLAGAPALVFGVGYLDGHRGARATAAASGAFCLALAGFVTARDPSTLLAFWELMTLVPIAAILIARRDRTVRRTVFVYLGVTHLGGVGAWVAILTLARHGALGGALEAGDGLQAVVAIAALVGFGTKAGLMPLHVWLPRAHPVAPSHISALMSGVMIKLALYGLIRVLFEWLGPPQLWTGLALLALGLLSALAGVLYALVQHDLKRLLAFHSIENIGIIALGLGASLVLSYYDQRTWAALAFAAALLHTLNHALFKGLLFLAAGAFERATGQLDLDRLGGLLRSMPWTGACFLVGSMAIAGLPPLNGFASEWLTLQALVHLALDLPVGASAVGAVAAAGLAATAALAMLCFVKVVGLVLLGPARAKSVDESWDRRPPMAAAMVFLAVCCVALGVAPGLLIPALVDLAPGEAERSAHLGFSIATTGDLPLLSVAVVLAAVGALLIRLRSGRSVATAPAWACGQPIDARLGWTSAGFTKPLRLVLESVLRPTREIELDERHGLVQRVRYHGEVPHLFDTRLYRPIERASLRAAAHARKLQSGSVRSYAGYLLAVLLVMLILARAGVLT